ncbi:MAG: HesA/MoeB/ThiF family protein [Magnetococcales bacterium]|nr:HesA/MoeB/ThiF family protein [Magnetococcales bacterium]
MPKKILLIGAGGLGSSVIMALIANPKGAPLGEIVIVDPDQTELSNLHRQIIYTMDDIGLSKAERTAKYVSLQRPDLKITPIVKRLQSVEEITAQAQDAALIIDGSDNFITRFDANDASLQLGIPLVHGAAIGFRGQLMTVIPGVSACLRCIFYGPPAGQEANCRSEGVLGPLVGEVGWLMAIEAIKILFEEGTPISNQLLTIDANRQRRRTTPLKRRYECSGCGNINLN